MEGILDNNSSIDPVRHHPQNAPMTDKMIVLSTCDSAAQAEKIARALIDERLAACVNVVPSVKSFYRWKGAVENASEWLLIIKSSRPLFEDLRAAIEREHSYEVPEVIALPVTEGSANYLSWMEGELRG
jgi:periplasmic divalent cation tolerance protein